MKNKLISNFFYQASYQILLIILPIITIPIVSNALGPEGVGRYNYVNSFAAYFILIAGLGMANYGVREISVVKKDKLKMSEKFWELALFNFFFSVITLLLYFVFCLFINEKLFFLINSISVFSCLFDITWFFSGIEDFKKITLRNFLIKLCSFVLIVILIKDKNDLPLYFIITSLSLLISQLVLWISINKYVYFIKVPLIDCFKHTKPAIEFFIAKIAITIYQNTTKTILGIFSTMAVVGIYSNAYSIVLMSGNVINAMNTIMIPRMSNMYSENDEEGMIKLLQKTIHLQFFFTIPIAFGIILVSEKLVPWFFGSDFLTVIPVLKCLSPVVVFQSFQMAVASQYLIPKKEMKEYNLSILFGAIITILVSMFTVSSIGIYGAVLGLNTGYIIVSIMRLKVLLKETSFVLEIRKILLFLCSAFLMLVITNGITKNMTTTLITTMVQVFIGTTVYFLITYAFKINPLIFLMKNK